ncbi:MAG: adenosylcobinamide-GDP ribazoletransferase [Pseudomonadota bacterium]
MTRLRFEAAAFFFALQFLTRVPIPAGIAFTSERFAAAPRYYPLVGGLVGFLCAALYLGLIHVFPNTLAVIVVTAFGILLTGAFHEDGLADTFDGIGGGQTREAALEIMKDSRLGTYGTLALGMTVAAKIAALAALPNMTVLTALMAAHALSRLSSLVVLRTSQYQRAYGTAKPVSDGMSNASLFVGATFSAFWTIPLYLSSGMGLITCGLAGMAAGHIGARAVYQRKIGGYTGDTLGAVQQLSELGFYIGAATWLFG